MWGIGWFIGMLNRGGELPFVVHVGLGFVLFRLIVGILNDSAGLYRSKSSYINDGHVRYTDYVFSTILRSVIIFLFAAPVLLVALLMSDRFVPSGIFPSFLGLLFLIFNMTVWSIPFSILGAKIADFSEFISNLTMVMFLVTPIVWYPEAAPKGTLQGDLMRANPFHHLIAIVRDPLLGGEIEPVTWIYMVMMTAIGLVLAWISYRFFSKKIPMWI